MRRRLASALGASIAFHTLLAAIVLAVLAARPQSVATQTPPPRLDIVYVARTLSGPSHGGGGRRVPTPPRPTEIPAHHVVTSLTAIPTPPAVEPLPVLATPVQTNLATMLHATGTFSFAPPGPGGTGPGTGIGDGAGPGHDVGRGGSRGGGDKPTFADNVESPTLIRRVAPEYSNDALRARIQGPVHLEAVVLPNGTVGRVTIIKSLHPSLDPKAIEAARKWLFQPGRQNGQPVEVIVTLILEFRLH